MKNLLTLLLCLALINFTFLYGFCQTEEEFDAILNTQFPGDGPGAVALVAKDGKIIYKKAFGKADLELGVIMKTDHVFRIGSITKQFTAAAILRLVEEGKLSLQDDITKHIKDYPVGETAITIENLLTHTSGIKNYTSMSTFSGEQRRKELTPEELISYFKNEPKDFAAGTDHRYSNSGYILLGYIIELISGQTYGQYIDEKFFQPLGMKNSFYDNSSRIIPNRIKGYQERNGDFKNSDYLSMTLPYAAGSLLSNVDDLLVWNEAVMNNKILNKASLEKAHAFYQLPNGRSVDYGYGWRLGNIQQSRTVKHGGLVNGFATFSVYLADEKIFAVILSNCDCRNNLEDPASRMAAIALQKPYQFNTIQLSDRELESYQGVYTPKNYPDKRTIAFEDGKLMYFSKGGSKSLLFPIKKDKFHLANSLATLEFERDSFGNISAYNISSLESPVTWIRTSEEVKALKVVTVAGKTLEKYVGKYQFSPDFIFSIVKEGDKIYGQAGQDKKELIPFDNHKFFARSIDGTIIFNLDKQGNVISLTKIQSDEMVAKKIE